LITKRSPRLCNSIAAIALLIGAIAVELQYNQ
jgi:hypothetical protein